MRKEGKRPIDRRRFEIGPGTPVKHRKETLYVLRIIDLDEVLAVDSDGLPRKVRTTELRPADTPESGGPVPPDPEMIDDADWRETERRMEAILPIVEGRPLEEVMAKAEEMGIHYTTLYRWHRRYRDFGGMQGLIPSKRGRRAGVPRIDPRAERVIREAIDEFYLTPRKPRVQWVIRKVHLRCHEMGIPLPSKNTIRNRISAIGGRRKLAAREGEGAARDRYDPVPGKFEAEYPLHVVQIDHTRMDVVVVDRRSRRPIGRPWLTLAIDVYSRMIQGYHLSLEAPSAASVAMCISSAVLPKEKILIEHGIEGEWNIWGFMDTVHVDNGADFRSKALERACAIHGIHIDFRPLGKTSYGGHIERVIGTMMESTHLLHGTTFSSIRDKGEYDPDANASLTMEELEKWFLTFVTKVYHRRVHSSLGMSPEEKFRRGILSEEGHGLPARPADPHTLYLDFLPAFERTVQRNGVNIDGINYYDPVLRPYVLAEDPATGKRRKFLFRRDPKNVSEIWFRDGEDGSYHRIPAADQSMPDMTLWELRAAKERAKDRTGPGRTEGREVLAAYGELFSMAEESRLKTKKARREAERKERAVRDYGRAVPPPEDRPLPEPSPEPEPSWDDIPDLEID